jgi:hypothetical protein
MSELLARVRGYFVEVDGEALARPHRARTPPMSIGLVAPPRIATAAGAALALELARRHRAPCALLCHWGPAAGGAPALRSAARAAAALRAREIEARAVGRLVRVVLDDDSRLVAATLRRAAAVVPGPAVLAIGRPRDDHVDRALRDLDAIAWIPPDEADASLLALVETSLEALGRPVIRCAAPGAVARRLAVAGVRGDACGGNDALPAGTQTFG